MKGSHNSLTFASPTRWWGHLFTFVWRCQSKPIVKQIAAGCHAFDLRFAPRPESERKGHAAWSVRDRAENVIPFGYWRSAHGIVDLDIDPVEEICGITFNCPEPAYVRLVLEKGSKKDMRDFAETCRVLQKRFPRITFFQGVHKPTWRQVFDFKSEGATLAANSLVQYVGSMSSSWLGKVWPWAWSRLHRRLPLEASLPSDLPIVLLDFVK